MRGDRVGTLVRVWVDALIYALVLAGSLVVATLVASVVTGGALVRAKRILFVVGWILLAYATVRLWPTSPDEADGSRSVPQRMGGTRFQSFVRWLPPLRWMRPVPPGDRIPPAGKLFLGSLLVLLSSFLMETVFDIG